MNNNGRITILRNKVFNARLKAIDAGFKSGLLKQKVALVTKNLLNFEINCNNLKFDG